MSKPSEPGPYGHASASRQKLKAGRPAEPKPKPVTIATLARATGLSQGAISSLLNEREYGIRLSTRNRDLVIKACREFGYIPNDYRAVVRIYPEKGETCVLVPGSLPGGLANPFMSRVAAGVLANTTRKPATMAVVQYEEGRQYAPEELPGPIFHGTASRIICVGRANGSICDAIHGRGLPAILVGHSSPIPGTTSVVADFTGAARLALGLLVHLGHTHIGIVGDPFGSPEPRMSELDAAIGSVAGGFGLQIDAQDVLHGDLSFEAGAAALESMLARSATPSALLCLSEAAAAGVVARAQARGVSIPGRLSVLAFVDHDAVPAANIPLTALVMPAEELGAVAVREAERQVREGTPPTAERVVVNVQLIERESCGPAKV
jgi:DNA-binding LacI/PurR family transcriptional regulator